MKWMQVSEPLENHPRKDLLTYYSRQFNLNPLVILHLFNLGINSESKIENFLFPSFTQFNDPYLFRDMKKAIYFIAKAIVNHELIVIFGDYDVDGMTSSAILYKGLNSFKANVQVRLPLREEGYGLSAHTIHSLPQETALIITVDNGSNAHEALSIARQRGIKVIVTDHHEITDGEPDCVAFINPKMELENYPFKELCGAGVALKVVQALFMADKKPWEMLIKEYIELAALGTIADLVSLTDENRTIVYYGLQKMNVAPSCIFKHLFSLLKINEVDSTKISFQIAPIFNSCGRIGDPNKAVQLLIAKDPCMDELRAMIHINTERKEMQRNQYVDLKERILQENMQRGRIIAIHGEYHKGIVGILAARVTEEFKKPAIVISADGVGSARIVHGTNFSMINTLTRCSQYLIKYGGHKAAAGLKVSTERPQLEAFFSALHSSAELEESSSPKVHYLAEMPFEAWDKNGINDFQTLEPYGLGNPKPIFYSPLSKIQHIEIFGKALEHLKLIINKKEIIAYGKAGLYDELAEGLTKGLYTFGERQFHFNLQEISK
ncbi:single-stranded-DNA-specific exonuclease RecJ [Paenibacillus sp. LMG 31458]|uniref:Single-stranded-DNA-specific exonuclease RecJ n=1 Tax=Paenibacillus phytorum TaxID=2654977 RepID=A0ABX1XY49_9BACL|nr:single-stranded-DNA-specific exonuclease RecJ [Paenibacillus phytorum]NOU73451.1 single-stranded-DNA-specific exonuclease RecJ [Paenibacillus phytorum]